MDAKDIEKLKKKLKEAKKNLKKQQEVLDGLAEDCVNMGKNLSDDAVIMEQSKAVDSAILEIYDLYKMIQDIQEKE